MELTTTQGANPRIRVSKGLKAPSLGWIPPPITDCRDLTTGETRLNSRRKEAHRGRTFSQTRCRINDRKAVGRRVSGWVGWKQVVRA